MYVAGITFQVHSKSFLTCFLTEQLTLMRDAARECSIPQYSTSHCVG